MIAGFKGTVICDGYSAYGHLPDVQFANCWAHTRRYWLKADSKNGRIGVDYCDRLYQIERKIKHLSPEERQQIRQEKSKPIVDEFFA
nr:transposase [Heyndrickxia vini]